MNLFFFSTEQKIKQLMWDLIIIQEMVGILKNFNSFKSNFIIGSNIIISYKLIKIKGK